jgi:cellulose synthase/poly-beta-1,6-N-acetylglucosamine synthase-like glycosyltransferase
MHWLTLILILPYLFLIFRIYKGLLGIKKTTPGKTGDIFISVVLPCRNEENNISGIISDLEKQTFKKDLYELIIVDDHSSDSTQDKASEYLSNLNMSVIMNKGNGKKMAVRTGVEASSGELIVTTDADCRVGVSWLETIAGFYNSTKAEMIICPVVLERGKGFFRRFQELEFLSLQGVTAGTASLGEPVMCNGAGLAFKKEAFLNNAGNLHYEIESGDDIFLLQSIKRNNRKGIKWIGTPGAEVTTRLSESLSSFLKQRTRWISKSGSYNDSKASILAIVTFVTILSELILSASLFFFQRMLPVFIAFLILKSLPDFLVLKNTATRYSRKDLMKWFIPVRLVYPLYVLLVVLGYPFFRDRWKS